VEIKNFTMTARAVRGKGLVKLSNSRRDRMPGKYPAGKEAG